MRRSLLIAAALAAAACSPDFDPASRIEKLRVVAIRAEPPEIDPAGVQTADLTSLVLRADYATTTRTTTVVHLACVPVPGDPNPTPCVLLQNLRDPAVAIAAGARQACAQAAAVDPGGATTAWPAIALAGFEACVDDACGAASASGGPLPPAQVAIPAGLVFPAAGVERTLGVQAVDLAFALDATPDELVAGIGTACPAADVADQLARLWAVREHVLSTKRVPIRGPASPNAPNRNPAVAGIVAGVTPLDPAAATTLGRGKLELAPVLPAGAAGAPEAYVKLDADGRPIEPATEEWVYSWFSTAGELKDLHTRSLTKPDEWTVWDAGPARVVVVVRDLRGGTSWAVRDVVFAP
jgi:hypothetical protein